MWVLWMEPMPLYLHDKHFTNEAIALPPILKNYVCHDICLCGDELL